LKLLLGTLLLSSLNTYGGIHSEGFVQLIGQQFWLKNKHDSRVVLPKVPACQGTALKGFKDLYVRLKWKQQKGKECFDALHVNAIVFDPLKDSFRGIRKK
jgi:hypothetical protein